MAYHLLMLVAAIAVFVASPTKAQDRRGCYSGGRNRRHGEVFTIPSYSHCLKYMCINGQVRVHDEGCEVNGECHRVGEVFEVNCIQHQCTKTSQGPYDYYGTVRRSTRCKDYRGNCHNIGEYFPFFINNNFYRTCTCRPRGNNLHYECQTFSEALIQRQRGGRGGRGGRRRGGGGESSRGTPAQDVRISSYQSYRTKR